MTDAATKQVLPESFSIFVAGKIWSTETREYFLKSEKEKMEWQKKHSAKSNAHRLMASSAPTSSRALLFAGQGTDVSTSVKKLIEGPRGAEAQCVPAHKFNIVFHNCCRFAHPALRSPAPPFNQVLFCPGFGRAWV